MIKWNVNKKEIWNWILMLSTTITISIMNRKSGLALTYLLIRSGLKNDFFSIVLKARISG